MEEMKEAIEELRAAERYFNNAVTKNEIDYATHRLNAAIARIDVIIEKEDELN